MGSALASTAAIAGTRVSFGWDGSGCSISCDAPSLKRASHGACLSAKPPRDGRIPSASKKCQGESLSPRHGPGPSEVSEADMTLTRLGCSSKELVHGDESRCDMV